MSKTALSSSPRMESALDIEDCFTATGFPDPVRKTGNSVELASLFRANLELPAFQNDYYHVSIEKF